MKKLYAVLFVFAVSGFCLGSCQSLQSIVQEPKVSIRAVDLAGISINGIDMICRLNVENPNAFDIPFPEVDWQLFINANSFINGTLKNDTKLRSRGTVIVDIPFSVTYSGLFDTFASLWNTKEAAYRIALGIRFPLPILSDKTYNLDFSGVVPLLQLPKISAGSFGTGRIDITGIEQNWVFNVENPNNFPIPVPDLLWDYAVNGISVLKGGLPGKGEIASMSQTPVNFTVGLRYADLLSLLGTLGNSSQLSSVMKLTSSFPIPSMENFTSSFDMAGILPLFR